MEASVVGVVVVGDAFAGDPTVAGTVVDGPVVVGATVGEDDALVDDPMAETSWLVPIFHRRPPVATLPTALPVKPRNFLRFKFILSISF